VSLWRRLFKKDQATQTARPLSLKEQYQRKVQLYAEIVTASNAALEIMAQMQARLHGKDYFSPAYIKLNCAIVLDQTRRVLQSLKSFTGRQDLEVAGVFDRIADQINAALSRPLENDFGGGAFPFEEQPLAGPQLLASGVAYPAKEADVTGALCIKAVRGWWPAVQEGTLRARRYRVAGAQVSELTSPETGPQEQWLTYDPDQGFVMAPLPPEFQEQPCLTEGEARQIADYYGQLESRYPNVQEVEWGLGPSREVILLRSLPHERPSFQESPGQQKPRRPLFSQGLAIYPGWASGPAFHIDVDHIPDNLTIPDRAVLFANKPALSLAPFLPKITALVVETGEPHGHLAFLVRDHQVPAIFAVGEGTSHIPEGTVISVDVQRLEVIAGPPDLPVPPELQIGRAHLPAEEWLERVSPYLFPLNTDPSGKPPDPAACRSIHDILLYASLVRKKEMFCFSLHSEIDRKDSVNLVTGRLVPIMVIDAGGGLSAPGSSVTFEAVSSIPFHAFLDGMMSIPWPKARPLDVKGFISVIGVTSTTPRAEDQLSRVSFALLSREYMNFSLCLGYHASTIEAYVGNHLDSNFIRFHYQGGAASVDRRLRRLQLIGEILVHLGFNVTVAGDLLDGMLAGEPEPKLLKKLEILGRLEVYTKQMDMVMSDDAAVSSYVAGFLEKHCDSPQVTQQQ
jgi:pyruvate, water dikinase